MAPVRPARTPSTPHGCAMARRAAGRQSQGIHRRQLGPPLERPNARHIERLPARRALFWTPPAVEAAGTASLLDGRGVKKQPQVQLVRSLVRLQKRRSTTCEQRATAARVSAAPSASDQPAALRWSPSATAWSAAAGRSQHADGRVDVGSTTISVSQPSAIASVRVQRRRAASARRSRHWPLQRARATLRGAVFSVPCRGVAWGIEAAHVGAAAARLS